MELAMLLKELAPIRRQIQISKKVPPMELTHKLNDLYMVTESAQKMQKNDIDSNKTLRNIDIVEKDKLEILF